MELYKLIFVANTFEVDVSILSVNCYKLFRSLPEDIWKVSTYLPLRAYMDNLQCIYAQQGDTASEHIVRPIRASMEKPT